MALFTVLAGPELLAEYQTLGRRKTGQAKLTRDYRLPACYVIHPDEHGIIGACYGNSLRLAVDNKIIAPLAFPATHCGYTVTNWTKQRLSRLREVWIFRRRMTESRRFIWCASVRKYAFLMRKALQTSAGRTKNQRIPHADQRARAGSLIFIVGKGKTL